MILLLETVLVILVVGVWWFIRDRKRYSEYPPGPVRFPFLGNMIQIALKHPVPCLAFKAFSKIHGDVVFLKMGITEAVTFNSLDSVKEILEHDKSIDRSSTISGIIRERNFYKNTGIIFCSGETWQELRRFTIRTLRDFGFGKAASMDVVINEEVQKFMAHLDTMMAKSSDITFGKVEVFDLSIVNVLWRLITGVNYELSDPRILHLLKLSGELIKSTSFVFDITLAYPFLWNFMPNVGITAKQMHNVAALKEFFRETIKECRDRGSYASDPECYIDVFLGKIDENANNSGSHYNDEQLIICLFDLFQAGSESTSRTLDFSVLYMLKNQAIQEKCQAEIDGEIGANEDIVIAMKTRIPYTYATVLECTRHSSVVPVTPVRSASEDFYFRGSLIKKDTLIMPNLHAAHFTEESWGDPQAFRPERFLKPDGTIDEKVAGNIVTFGGGRRVCLAESLARASLFAYFATLLKNYKFIEVPGSPEPTTNPKVGVTYSVTPFKVRVVPRK